MEEIIIAIAARVSEYLVFPAIHEGKCLFCAGRIIKNVEKEKEKLTLRNDEVSRDAKEAERKAEMIEDVVQNWQKEVENLLTEVENMEQQVKASSCFGRPCPTWRRYRLCKQLANKTKRMTELNNNSKFQRFSRLATLPTIEYFSSQNFTWFESTKLACNQLLEALKDDSCYMICLYGMGGCGKTTLAKEVGKKAKDLNLFEKVVFTTVSQTLDIKSIQDEIADLLNLRFNEQSKAGRARRLSLRLQSGEKILLILDDVWAKLNLEDIGIPLDGSLKGCKVLFTTRLQQLCALMECQRNVPMHLLSEEEGWVLFQKKACLIDESSSKLLNDVARQVALECKGLPIAIEAVGISLVEKSIDSWMDALNRLRQSKPVEVEEGVRDAFTCLQYSYDHLKIEEAKGIFLMCSMFPEDHDISTEDLFRYAIGLGLCKEVESFEISRSRVNNCLNYLVDSSLLMHSERRKNHFKMHDLVRDVALWISSKEDHTIMVSRAKGIHSLATDGTYGNCYALSTWYEGDDRFPHQLDAPKLKILLLNSKSHLDFSYPSFEGIKKLKVMAIIMTEVFPLTRLSLPQSNQWLTNLQTLRLVNCELGDISFVVSLRSLEILDLQHSKFKSLPNGIEEQNKLKLLDLSDCIIDDCCDEVLRRCSQLEELYLYSTKAYQIIKSYKCFIENASLQKLQRYVLQIGNFVLNRKRLFTWSHKSTRALFIGECDNISTSSAAIKGLLQKSEVVVLEHVHGSFRSIFPEGSMKELTELALSSCAETESLISTTHVYPALVELGIFQKLERVHISDCPQLQSIFLRNCNLYNLKYCYISGCPRLTSLFPISVAQTLKLLELLYVEYCEELKYIIFNDAEDSVATREQCHTCEDLSSNHNQIQIVLSELEVFYLSGLPNLIEICTGNCHLVWPSLHRIEWRNCPNLITLCGDVNIGLELTEPHLNMKLQSHVPEDAQLANEDSNIEATSTFMNELSIDEEKYKTLTSSTTTLILSDISNVMFIWINFQNIYNLKLIGCQKLKSIFSATVIRSLPELNRLEINDCDELEEVISNPDFEQVIENQSSSTHPRKVCFLNLFRLEVKRCKKLKCIFTLTKRTSDETHDGELIEFVFPKLRCLIIEELPSLVDICGGFQYQFQLQLQNLHLWEVKNCPNFSSTTIATLNNFIPARQDRRRKDDGMLMEELKKEKKELKEEKKTRIEKTE